MEQKVAPRQATEILVLCIYQNDLRRMYSRFRPYLKPRTGFILGFKPRPFLSSDGKLQFLRQEATVATSDRAQLVEYAQRSRKHDPYAIWPEMAFPYLATLARVANSKLFYDNHFAEKVWGNSKALDLMDAVIDRFVANTELYGSKPVVVFVRAQAEIHSKCRRPTGPLPETSIGGD